MPEYTVSLVNIDTGETYGVLGPFYRQASAEYNAKKASKEDHSPSVLARIDSCPSKRGYPKHYRMGRVYKVT